MLRLSTQIWKHILKVLCAQLAKNIVCPAILVYGDVTLIRAESDPGARTSPPSIQDSHTRTFHCGSTLPETRRRPKSQKK